MTQNIKLLLSLLLVLFFSSCMRYKKIIYLKDVGNKEVVDSIYKTQLRSYKIQPADILSISIKTLNPEVEKMFNLMPENIAAYGTTSMFYVKGYSVDQQGAIVLPVIGKKNIGGMTLAEALSFLQSELDKYVKDARLDIKLVSFRITILGEVRSPSQFTIYNDKQNIFEAVGLAGDITYYGNRKNVMIMRQLGDTTKILHANLTDRNILTKPEFYIMPNDIIYVEPVRAIGYRLNIQDFSMLITTISTSLTVLLIILKFGL